MFIKHKIRQLECFKEFENRISRLSEAIQDPSRAKRRLSIFIFSSVAFFSILIVFKIIDPYPLKDWIYLRLTLEDLGFKGAGIYLLMLAVIPLFSPLSLLIVTGSAAFGPLLGTLLSYIGCLINASVAFFLVKALSIEEAWGKDKRSKKIKTAIQEHGYVIVLALQLITLIPFTLINAAAAGSGVPWKDFMKATSIGVWPCVIIYSFLGNRIISKAVSPEVYFSAIFVAALTLVFIAVRKKNSENGKKSFPEMNNK